MDKKISTIKIEATDFYGDNCLKDQVGSIGAVTDRRPQGRVHIYEEVDGSKRKLIHKSNLVVYIGRQMLAQRAMNIDNASVTGSTNLDFISWFGVGDGGVRPADPLDPVPPINSDEELSARVMIRSTGGATYADEHTVISSDYPEVGWYKKAFDSVEYEADNLNDDAYLIAKITTTIDATDANGKQLSEAGLFSSDSFAVTATNFTLFARVTYPSLIKTSERRLIFVWYLYF